MRTLIKNGTIIDPANHIHARNNLLLQDGKVLATVQDEPEADVVLDAVGKYVCPGFIDIHMHEDPYDPVRDRLIPSIMTSMLRMGVTTAIGGNCGINTVSPIRYLELMDRDGGPVNMGLLAGHTFLREQAGHLDKYAPITPDALRRLSGLAQEALEAGCFGISFGIRYVPGISMDEMVETARGCRKSGKFIAAHVRDDAAYIFRAVQELIDVGRALDLPVQNSHVGSMGGFGQMERLLAMMDAYRANGMDLSGDCYPYYAFSTRIGETTYDDGFLERYQTDYSVIEVCEGPYKGQRCTEAIFRTLRREAPRTITVCHVMKPEDVDMALLHPNIMLASDGLMDNGQGHPRAAGAFPRFVRNYVGSGRLSLDEAVYKMATMPAAKLGLSYKGNLRSGADADVVVLDLDRITDRATFDQPNAGPEGLDYVLVGGEVAVDHDRVVRSDLGRAVRKH
ncbi:amidohydrolase family protein [Intestinimonas butyriciproducens]|uniref:amidohydrolase family protein n=1 Tax=Intestinimonas butyriciproducens TaxID=1297617 RepID=UPI0034E4774E